MDTSIPEWINMGYNFPFQKLYFTMKVSVSIKAFFHSL